MLNICRNSSDDATVLYAVFIKLLLFFLFYGPFFIWSWNEKKQWRNAGTKVSGVDSKLDHPIHDYTNINI